MKRDTRKIFGLVLQYMDLPEGDARAKRYWERDVREAYPYGEIRLTEKLGWWMKRSGRSA